MGIITLLLLLLLLSPKSVSAATEQIHVTASVLPSQEWISQIQTNSSVTRSPTHYIINLSDGQKSLKNQTIIFSDITTSTNSNGQAYFVKNFNLKNPKFYYHIMGESIEIPYLGDTILGVADTVASCTTRVSTAAFVCDLVCCFVSSTNPGNISPIIPSTKTPPTGTSLIFFPKSQLLASFNFNLDTKGGGGSGSVGKP